jgi:CubicO group peptidase (beta-lactamase class C family)
MSSEDRLRINRVLADLRPYGPVRPAQRAARTLSERMTELHTPGASVAVIDNFDVAWVKGSGVRKAGEDAAVVPDTPFQSGSISKPVFALAIMRLCQDRRMDLDVDVQTYLKSWQLPQGDGGWTPKVSLRRLLSHSAGTTVHGFPGYPPDGIWPSLQQVLDGVPPANTLPVFVDLIPGLQSRYSGGGTTIAQLAATDLTGLPFPDLMQELVLAPLGMNDSSYEQPPPSRITDRAAVAHPVNGLPIAEGWHVYPEMGAAGLWTTADDLARMGVALMRGLRGETSNLGLSRESLSAMVCPQLPNQPAGGDFFGLGWQCKGQGDELRFGHAGTNRGYHAEMRFYPATGQGAVVMINSNEGWCLPEELFQSLEREYGWPTSSPRIGEAPVAADVEGTYRDNAGRIFRLEQRAGKFLLWVDDQDALHLSPCPDGTLSAKTPQIGLRFESRSDGSRAMHLTQGGAMFEAIAASQIKKIMRCED